MKLLQITAGTLGVLLLGSLGTAQIERLTLEQMVAKTDSAIHGTISAKHTFRVYHPVDGTELYITTMTIDGRSLVDGRELTTEITFCGGSDGVGCWNSEAPSDHETAIGNEIVAFYRWCDNMSGDVASNALYAAHGGLYTTFEANGNTIVQGRGDGFAVDTNVQLNQLDAELTALYSNK